jgi:pimeloyl-ACP methyl ester carboxylesterase
MHGFSDALSLRRGADALPQGVKEALDQVLREPAVVIGNSLGGYMAVKYALARPKKVRALVLASPAGAPMSDEEKAGIHGALTPKSHDQALKLVDNVFPSITEERTGTRRNPLRHMLAAGMRQRLGQADVQRLLNIISTEHYLREEELAQLMVPVLLMWGQGDRLLPRTQLEFFRRSLPNASVEEPALYGHSPYLEETASSFLQRIISFVGDLPKL